MGIAIVSPEQVLAESADNPTGALIVDARRRRSFDRGHVPGAIMMDWESWCERAPADAGPILAQEGFWGVLAPVDLAASSRRLTSLGLRDQGTIIVYADGPRTRGREGRIAWMLLYFGALDVRLLDGGWSGWVEAGGPVQSEEPVSAEGDFTVRVQYQRRRTLEELESEFREATLPLLIDTRSQVEFDGEVQEYLPRRGHLPGAILMPFIDLFDDRGRYVSHESYVSRLPSAVAESSHMAAYCEVGVRASLFALLHEAHTGHTVPVYDGSIMEWGRHHELPMV